MASQDNTKNTFGEVRLPAGTHPDLAANLEFGALDIAALVFEFVAGELQSIVEKYGAQTFPEK